MIHGVMDAEKYDLFRSDVEGRYFCASPVPDAQGCAAQEGMCIVICKHHYRFPIIIISTKVIFVVAIVRRAPEVEFVFCLSAVLWLVQGNLVRVDLV